MRTQTDPSRRPTDLPLLDFIPTLNPRYERPEHLKALVDLFERMETEAVFALVSVPPQFAKTETILAGLARLIGRQPWRTNAYVSYAADLAYRKSRTCRDYASAAGVQMRDDVQSVKQWSTVQGGGLLATGIGGPLTGSPVNGVLVIDDPHKNRQEAESALIRQRNKDWYTSTARSRVHPGASILVVHTRWHVDDMIGELSRETDEMPDGTTKPTWDIVNLPAVLPSGEPLWHRRPIAFLEKARQASEYDWWSLYMGSPRPRGTSVFRGARFYDELPNRYRVGKGVDLAYTAKTRADWSCAIVLLQGGKDEKDRDLFYVAEVRRAQCEVPEFARELAALNIGYPIGSWHWFCSTTERGVAQVVTADGVQVDPVLATADKFVRAQSVAAAWNEGRVLVPRDAPWLKAFVDELGAFTGVGDRHDDQCVAEGTLVDTPVGARPIETLASGDMVWTRSGPRRVTAAAQTNPESRVFDVALADGRVLTATANHPVFVVGKGFTRVDALTCDDNILLRCRSTRASDSTGSSSTATPSLRSFRISDTSGPESLTLSEAFRRFTKRSGKAITAPSRMVATFTIATRTPSTTRSIICSVSHLATIAGFTRKSPRTSSALTSSAFGRWLRSGTGLRPGLSGTVSTASRDGQSGRPPLPSARSAGGPSAPTSPLVPGSARNSAASTTENRRGCGRIRSRAFSVAPPFARITRSKSVARARVATVCERTERVPVYNLSVEGGSEYFANGILVHNCDALASAFESLKHESPAPLAVSGVGYRFENEDRGYG